MLGSRLVATSADAFVLLVGGPWRGLVECGYSVVSPVGEERDGWMIDLFQLRGEVGAPSELGHKGLPGLCLRIGVTKRIH